MPRMGGVGGSGRPARMTGQERSPPTRGIDCRRYANVKGTGPPSLSLCFRGMSVCVCVSVCVALPTLLLLVMTLALIHLFPSSKCQKPCSDVFRNEFFRV